MTWWFFSHESTELKKVPKMLHQANLYWLLSGFTLSFIYILIQALMYKVAFRATSTRVSLFDMCILFLKRNLTSVFMPAGGLSSLALFGNNLEKQGIEKSKIHLASALYGFIGIVSIAIVGIPSFIYALYYTSLGWTTWLALGLVCFIITLIFTSYRSIVRGGKLITWIEKHIPILHILLKDFQNNQLHRKYIIQTILVSILIEFCGIAHLYIAMKALNIPASLFVAVLGYVVAVIFMLISPFLRGLGAVELSMAFLITEFGYEHETALLITMLYRTFEFWFPLILGVFAFLIQWNRFLLRLLPAALLTLLGIVNILSALTPSLFRRTVELREFIPIDIFHVSNFLVFAIGIFMLATGVFLLRAQRTAFIFACLLCSISIFGNLLKAYDYEEAILSSGVLLSLLLTRNQYIVRGTFNWNIKEKVTVALCGITLTLLYGIIGFYNVDTIHFGKTFTFQEALKYTIKTFFLTTSNFNSIDKFGTLFIRSIQFMSFTCFCFVFYLLLKSWLTKTKWQLNNELESAAKFATSFGNSSMDYFKYYPDKQIFWSYNQKAFISFKASGIILVVLEKPIAINKEESRKCITEFEEYSRSLGSIPIYYRVNTKDLYLFEGINKKSIFLGQEAIVNLQQFRLEGKENKSLRNSINKIEQSDYQLKTYNPPLTEKLLDQLQKVSNNWLEDTNKQELWFSQGVFSKDKIGTQTVITLEHKSNSEVEAFLNIIPDYASEEGTYDLIRKKNSAPNGAMDALLITLFEHFKQEGIRFVNLGMAPMSGITKVHNLGEEAINFAYKNIPNYKHYKGLRAFKEKFNPQWQDVFLLYNDDLQIISIPKALKAVMKNQ